MSSQAWIQPVAFLVVLVVLAWPLGRWLAAVVVGRLPRWLAPVRVVETGLRAPAHSERTHYLRVYMGQLRQKLEADPAQPRHLLTETGVGYRLLAD